MKKGELYDVNCNSIMEGMDIQTLAKYHTLTNKTNIPAPKGYATYKNAMSAYQKQQVEQSPPRDVASGTAFVDARHKSSIKDEIVVVKPAAKKRKSHLW